MTDEWVAALSDEELEQKVINVIIGNSAYSARLRQKLLEEAERRADAKEAADDRSRRHRGESAGGRR